MNPLASIGLVLRLSPVKYALPLLFGIEVGVVLLDGQGWRTEWRWAMDWLGAGLFLAAPLAAGLAAWRAQSVRATRGEAVTATRSRVRLFALEAGGVFAWVALAHLLLVVAVIVACYSTGLRGVPPLLPVLLQLVALLAFVAAGYLLAQFSDSRMLPPVVAVGAAFAVIQSTGGSLPTLWLDFAGATAPLVGLDYRTDVALAQAALYLAIAVLGLAAFRGSNGLTWRPLVLVPAALAVLLAGGWLASAGSDRFVLTGASESLDCVGDAPEVCMQESSSTWAEEIQVTLRLLTEAAGTVADTPARFVQVVNGQDLDVDGRQFFLNSSTVTPQGIDPQLVTHYFVWNRDCLLSDTAPPMEAQRVLGQLSVALEVRAGLFPPDQTQDPVVDAFLELPEARQQEVFADALAASERCAYDELPDEIAPRS